MAEVVGVPSAFLKNTAAMHSMYEERTRLEPQWTFFLDHKLLIICFDHDFFSTQIRPSKPHMGYYVHIFFFCSERIVGDLSEEVRPRICFLRYHMMVLKIKPNRVRGTGRILVDYHRLSTFC